MRRGKRNSKESSVNGSPAWMTTYGDMVTLLLAFFVLLYSFSTLDAEKFKIIISSLQNTFGVLEGGQTIDTSELISAGSQSIYISKQSREELEFRKIFNDFAEYAERKNLEGKVEIEMQERGIVIHIMEGALFDSGWAYIRQDAEPLLDEIAQKLKNVDKVIRVEGHTDDVPVINKKYPTNWELSVARAVNVVRYFIEKHGITPYRLVAVGYSKYRPLVPNTSAENRALNRRVDIVILKSRESD